jgi:hypothetical protein
VIGLPLPAAMSVAVYPMVLSARPVAPAMAASAAEGAPIAGFSPRLNLLEEDSV